MKNKIAIFFATFLFSLIAFISNSRATEPHLKHKSFKIGVITGAVKSTRFGTAVEISRIVELKKLELRPDLQINVTVRDMGGTTDATPTQELFFTMYTKGEIFSTDATFNLGAIYDFKMARRVSEGIYEILVGGIDLDSSMPKSRLIVIDAKKAIKEILNVRCTKIDCPASDEFEAIINVVEK